MRLNPLEAHRRLTSAYDGFTHAFRQYRDPEIAAWMRERIEHGGFLWRGPYLTLQRRFATGPSLEEFVERGLLHRRALDVFGSIRPYSHQAEALEKVAGEGRNVVVTTGTGSGKSFAFLLPIVSEA